MIKATKDESGFGVVGLVLIVVVIAVLGVGGWFIYDRNKDTSSTDSPSSTNSSTMSEDDSAETVDEAQDDIEYVVINGWGVKIPEEHIPQGFTYERKSTPNSPVVFNSTALKAAGCAADGSGYYVVRGTADDTYITHGGESISYKAAYDGKAGSDTEFKMESNGYYYFDDAGLACGGSAEELAAQQAIADALREMENG